MSTSTKTCVILFLLVGLTLATQGETATVYVADTPIALPAPEGFFRYDGKSKKVDQMQLSFLAASNRLLASFGSEDDLAQTLTDTYPRLERNFNAQSVKKLEEISFTPAHFTELKTAVRTQMDSMRQKLGDKIAELESGASSNLSKEFQSRTDFKLGDMILLGVFDETPDSFSFSMLTKYRLTVADLGDPVEGVSIVAASALYLRNRVIYLYCTAKYQDKRDIDWARSNVKKWRDEVLAANRGNASSVPSTRDTSTRVSSSDSIWEGVLTKGLAAGIVGAIIAAIAGLIYRFKKSR